MADATKCNAIKGHPQTRFIDLEPSYVTNSGFPDAWQSDELMNYTWLFFVLNVFSACVST